MLIMLISHCLPTRILFNIGVLLLLQSSVVDAGCATDIAKDAARDTCFVEDARDEISLVQMRNTLSRRNSPSADLKGQLREQAAAPASDSLLATSFPAAPKWQKWIPAEALAETPMGLASPVVLQSDQSKSVELLPTSNDAYVRNNGVAAGTNAIRGTDLKQKEVGNPSEGKKPWQQLVEKAMSSGKQWRGVLETMPEEYQGRRRFGEIRARDFKPPTPIGGSGAAPVAAALESRGAFGVGSSMAALTGASLEEQVGDPLSSNYFIRQNAVYGAYARAKQAANTAAMKVKEADEQMLEAVAADENAKMMAGSALQ